jgi:hypothetical protein
MGLLLLKKNYKRLFAFKLQFFSHTFLGILDNLRNDKNHDKKL